jgi:hypothetical protein
MSRWTLRTVVLMLVPALLTCQVVVGTSWLDGVWDGVASRDGFLVALALSAAGSIWTLVLTRPEHGPHNGSRNLGESHSLRSLLATEQLAVRLAVGVAAPDAWHVVAQSNHFPPGAAMPAVGVEEALALVEQLRYVARRRRLRPVRSRIAAILRPLVACLLPASVIILLL